MAAPLPTTPRLITFDTYGTLVDWDTALRAYLRDLFADRGVGLDVDAFHERWYLDHALPAVAGPFVPYRELLATTMADALTEAGVPAKPDELAGIGDAMARSEPFADSVDVLATLARHTTLATISNSQCDIIAESVRRLGDPFTYVITGEVVGSYKPHPALFQLVLARAGVPPADVVHVAQSQYVDLPRSVPMGLPTVWINRHAQSLAPGTPEPTAELPDLTGLPDLLGLHAVGTAR